ncbi:MAG: hypothetical protein GEU78_10370 [Actinobacteria bacterium]|nr:hypothetical protein [Actinomycetota bacterium]
MTRRRKRVARSRVPLISEAKARGFRSKFELQVAKDLEGRGVAFEYEPHALPYRIDHMYWPDLLLPGDIYVEIKGYLDATDRRKMRAVKLQHPDLDIRLLFQAAHKPIYKGAKSTRAEWADKHGFPWAEKRVPKSWLT